MEKRRFLHEEGFSLIEVLISLTILAVGLFGLLGMVGTNLRALETGKRQSAASNFAAERIEVIKAIPYSNIQSTGTDGNVTRTCTGADPDFTCIPNPSVGVIDNVSYSWIWQVIYIDLDGYPDSDDIKRINMTVSWTDINGSHSLTYTVLRKI